MTITRTMLDIDQAINEESWEWLQDNLPVLADAVGAEVQRGAKPEEIRRHVMRRTQRDALAARCEQAAGYLEAQKDGKR